MSVDPVPRDIPAVHDLLQSTLTTAAQAGAGYPYGFALFPRLGRFGDWQFGLATSGGESTTLTYRMLQSLHAVHLYVSGRVAAVVKEGLPGAVARPIPVALYDQPVLRLTVQCWMGATGDERAHVTTLISTFLARELSAPLILLAERRPSGWPN